MENLNLENIKIFKAFSDEIRLEIIKNLKIKELCACNIMEILDISQSALSYHMKILCDSKIVNYRQDGKWTYYTINKENCLKASKLILEITGNN